MSTSLARVGLAALFATAAVARVAADEPASSDAARAAYASAAAFQNREAWDLAAEEWQALLTAHPQDPLALKGRYYLAICQLKNGDWPGAQKTLQAVVASKADADTIALARWELARGAFATAQAKPAPEAFAAAAAELQTYLAGAAGRPQAADALHFLGEALWQAGTRDEALAAWQRFLKEQPKSPRLPEVLYALGVGQAETGKRDEAAATLDRFAKEFPQHALAADVALWRADLATTAGRPADAEKILAPLVAAKTPKAADALDRLGQARWSRKDWPGAAEAFARLAKEHADSPLAAAARVSAGRALVEAGRPADARPLFEQAAAGAGPAALDAAHRLAVLEIDAGNRPRALEIADRALASAAQQKQKGLDPAVIPRLELDRVEALWDMPGRRAEAATAADALVARHPGSSAAAPALVMAALALIEAKKPADAATRIDGFLARHAATAPADSVLDLRAVRAEALLAAGRPADAADAYRALLTAEPKSPRRASWLLREGAALSTAKEWQRAHDALAAAAAELRGDDRAEAVLLDATALVELGKPADAAALLAPLAKDLPKWPRRPEALLLQVRALREAGDQRAARAVAEGLVKEFPEGPGADVAWHRLGQLRQDAKEHDAAIDAFAKSVALQPQGPRAPWSLLATGWCHEAQGRLDEAITAWTRLVDEHPKSSALAAGLLARGDARQRRRDFAGGLADAQRVLAAAREGTSKLEPAAAAEARLLEGLCLAGDKKHAQAAAAFRRLLDEQPGCAVADRALFELGLAQALDGKPADAAATFADLVKRFPKSGYAADAWLELGEARWAAADWPGAAEAYTKALEATGAAGAAGGPVAAAGPVAEQARHKLGWTFVRRGDHAAAAREFAAQVAACPGGPLVADGRALLGESLLLCGKVDEAAQALDAALADAARLSSPELRGVTAVRAAEAAARRGQWQRSLEIAETFLAAAPDSPQAPQARYAAAWARQNLGKLDEALAGYRGLADAARTETAARARLMEGEVLFEKGDHKEAIKAFFKVAYGFGEAQAPRPFHPWQAQATYEAARCFEVLRKPEQARTLYAELVERYPDSEQVAAARKRLADLPAPAPSGDSP
ncbi:MAG: tetratricopeptide repeat protein [Planctomycetaceae bacterium]